MSSQRRRLRLAVILGGMALLAACGGSQPAAPVPSASTAPPAPASAGGSAAPSASPGNLATVRVGGLGSTIDRAFFIGQDKGFFAEQGIKLDLTTFRGASEMLPLLATNKLDVGTGGSNPGFFNAQASGIGVKIVSDVTIIPPPQGNGKQSAGLVLRSDLAGQVKTMADIKGRTIAINALQGIGEEQIDKVLQSGGLKLTDVNVVALPYPDQLSALANKKIDAAMMIEPFATLAQQQKAGVAFFDLGKVMPNYPAQWLFYSVDFINSQPDLARRFMVAHMKALRYDTDGWWHGKNHDDVVNLFVQHVKGMTPQLAEQIQPTTDETNGNVNMQAIGQDEDYFLQHGWQKQRVDPAKLVDTSFSEAARKALGPYQP
jgi:NitT/TauT family transport system substrate-binding protein